MRGEVGADTDTPYSDHGVDATSGEVKAGYQTGSKEDVNPLRDLHLAPVVQQTGQRVTGWMRQQRYGKEECHAERQSPERYENRAVVVVLEHVIAGRVPEFHVPGGGRLGVRTVRYSAAGVGVTQSRQSLCRGGWHSPW